MTLSISESEEVWLKELKNVFGTDKDGEALKNGALVGLNVIHAYFKDNFKLVTFIKRERKKKKSPYLKDLK